MKALERRRVLTALSTATLSAVAGCTDLLDGDSESDDDESEPDDESSSSPSPDEIATDFVEAAADERFADARELMAERARPETAQIERIWMGYTAVHGEFEAVTDVEEPDGIDPQQEQLIGGIPDAAVDVALAFERGTDGLRVTFDDDAITGLFFDGGYERPSYVDPDSFTEEPLTIEAEGCHLDGVATVPTDAAADGDVPGVVIVHGSGAADKNLETGATQMYRDLAEGLASRGIATLRYDKRTFRCQVDFADHTLDRVTVDDALVAIDELRDVEGVDADRIVVAGHSMGGLAVPRIVDRDGGLAGGAALAAPGRPMYELPADQYEHRATVGDHEWEQLSNRLEEIEAETERVREGDYDAGEAILDYPGALWQSLEAYDHFETARSVDAPLFFLQGERDFQVRLEADFERWTDELADRPATTFESYEGLDHRFMSGRGPSVIYEYMARNSVEERVVDDLVDWIDGL